MSKLPAPRARVQPDPLPQEQVYLTITIRAQDYDLREMHDCDPSVARRAWQLTKLPAFLFPDVVYHCCQAPAGFLTCDCADAEFRERQCKHLTALLQLGFLERRPSPPAARSAGDFAANYPNEYAAEQDDASRRASELDH